MSWGLFEIVNICHAACFLVLPVSQLLPLWTCTLPPHACRQYTSNIIHKQAMQLVLLCEKTFTILRFRYLSVREYHMLRIPLNSNGTCARRSWHACASALHAPRLCSKCLQRCLTYATRLCTVLNPHSPHTQTN